MNNNTEDTENQLFVPLTKKEIMEIAKERAIEMSVGDIEQDKQCAYNYAIGMEEMQHRLLNKF